MYPPVCVENITAKIGRGKKLWSHHRLVEEVCKKNPDNNRELSKSTEKIRFERRMKRLTKE